MPAVNAPESVTSIVDLTNRQLHILHLEDDADYTHLVEALLRNDGITPSIRLVETAQDFENALAEETFDVILADYQLPNYNGLKALRHVRNRCPETPFLLVSGTMGEQAAIESLQAGATDYVLKLWPERLVPAIRRAVREARERYERRRAECELMRQERYFRALTENSLDVLSTLDRDGNFLYCSPSIKRVLGYDAAELLGHAAFELMHPEDLPRVRQEFQAALAAPEQFSVVEFRIRHTDGSWRHIESVGQNRLEDPEVRAVIVNSRDVTDRNLARAGFQETERQYQLIFNDNPSPMWVFDHESLVFLEVNDAAIQHYGYTREEFLAMRLKDLNPSGETPALIEYLHRLVGGGPSSRLAWAGVWQHRTKDGAIIDVEIKWSPILFKGQAASLTMVNDISERKRAEHRDRALSKLGQDLSSATSPLEAAGIIRSIADDLFTWDAFSLNLYSAEEDLICPILNIDTDRSGARFDAKDSAQPFSPTARARRVMECGAEIVSREEPPAFDGDGAPMGDTSRPSASLLLAPIRNRTRVIGILSVQSYKFKAYDHRDLDLLQTLADHCSGALERIRAEQALHESEMLFHSVWENSVDGMRLTDREGATIAVNKAYCALVKLEAGDLEGKPFTVVYADAERPDVILREYQERFDEQRFEKKVEAKVTLRDGQVVTFEETSSMVDLRERGLLLLSVFRDVTNQRRLEDQLRQSQKMEAIGQLAGGVAHDFNNILTVIHGHASLLGSHPLPEPCTRSAQQITHAAERAAGLTRQLLTFGRRQMMQLRSLDMNEVVANVTRMLARILGEDIAVQLNYSPRPAMVHADAGMMEQVLMNLAVNSRDAMPKGGLLTIRVSNTEIGLNQMSKHPEALPGQFVCLEVTDTGCGIPQGNLRRIFDPFFTTKEVGKGTGLGLATVYGIVKQHQGWVQVESEIDQGTTFRILLPACSHPSGPRHEESAEPAVSGGNETILVVEDEAAVRELVCGLLSRDGYRILEAESGAKALKVWREHGRQIDMLLTDLVMPDNVNGRELAEKLLAEAPGLKVLFTSGYSAEVVGTDFAVGGKLKFLQKPYQPKTLAAAVRQCLDAAN